MIDFSAVTNLSIPEGAVTKIVSGAKVLWEKYVAPAITNLVRTAIDTNGSIFNKNGYENGYRLSSSGVTKALTNAFVTGFIKAKANDVFEITGGRWSVPSSTTYLCAYDANFTCIGGMTSAGTQYGTKIFSNYSLQEYNGDSYVDHAAVTLANVSNIAYIRISGGDAKQADGELMIVTKAA